MAESPVKVTVSSIPSNARTIATVSNSAWQYVDPVAEKFKELEERIDAWQNKFEFVDVREK